MIVLLNRYFSFNSEAQDEIIIDDLCLKKTYPIKLAVWIAKIFKSLQKAQNSCISYQVLKDGKEIGDLQLEEVSADEVNIVWIGIDKSFRGQGYAQKILKWIINQFKGKYNKLTLEVPGNSPDARHIYEKLGFKEVEYLGDDDVWDGLTRMELKL